MDTPRPRPRLLVFSSLFPSAPQPRAALFIRERMFRVGRFLPLQVVSPRPWSPADALIRRWHPHYRPPVAAREIQDGFPVYFPRFPALPRLLRNIDGRLMAWSSYPLLRRLGPQFDLIDAHFAYPDGYAASLLAEWLHKRVTITLRGTEVPHSRDPVKRDRITRALKRADRVFTVAGSLAELALELGADPRKVEVVGNGVDIQRFRPIPRQRARAELGLAQDAPVLITVGGLVERKGFHRVIRTLPWLLERFPGLTYLIVGGPSAEGDWGARLRELGRSLGVAERIRFLGSLSPDELKRPLSAANVFVLASANEGWANVILEAMACGLPVVATDVGGNREVVRDDTLGLIVPFGDESALAAALDRALQQSWDHQAILDYAAANAWERKIDKLTSALRALAP
jgi:glycosyltransferase involved in cell wall biosynthesis